MDSNRSNDTDLVGGYSVPVDPMDDLQCESYQVMSRHNFADAHGTTWTVGWDEPTVTFYVQRELPDGELEDVTGERIGEHTRVESIVEALREQVEIPAEILADLEQETPAFATPAIKHADARRDELAAALVAATSSSTARETSGGVER